MHCLAHAREIMWMWHSFVRQPNSQFSTKWSCKLNQIRKRTQVVNGTERNGRWWKVAQGRRESKKNISEIIVRARFVCEQVSVNANANDVSTSTCSVCVWVFDFRVPTASSVLCRCPRRRHHALAEQNMKSGNKSDYLWSNFLRDSYNMPFVLSLLLWLVVLVHVHWARIIVAACVSGALYVRWNVDVMEKHQLYTWHFYSDSN